MTFGLVSIFQITCALRPHATSCNDNSVFSPDPTACALFTSSVILSGSHIGMDDTPFPLLSRDMQAKSPIWQSHLLHPSTSWGAYSRNTQLALPANVIDRIQRTVALLSAWLRANFACLQSNAR